MPKVSQQDTGDTGEWENPFSPHSASETRSKCAMEFLSFKTFTGELKRPMLGTSLVPSGLELKILALSGIWKCGIFLSIVWIPGRFG